MTYRQMRLATCATTALATTLAMSSVACASPPDSLAAAQSAASQDLLRTNGWVIENGRFFQCGPLPTDKKLLDALKFADDDTTVNVPGLTHGVSALPARLLRSSYCISPRPSGKDVRGLAEWYERSFTVKREIAPVTTSPEPTPPHIQFYNPSSSQFKKQSGDIRPNPTVYQPWGGNVTFENPPKPTTLRVATSYSRLKIPNFKLGPIRGLAGNKCATAGFDSTALWSGIGGYTPNSAPNLLQAGVFMQLTCGQVNMAPVPSLYFFAEYYPAEAGEPLPFPVQIQTTDDVNMGVYYATDANGNITNIYYDVIDFTKNKGLQVVDNSNTGSTLFPDSAETIAEAPTYYNSTTGTYQVAYAVKLETNPFPWTIATYTLNDSTTAVYDLGTDMKHFFNGVSVPFLADKTKSTNTGGSLGQFNFNGLFDSTTNIVSVNQVVAPD